MKSFIKNSTLTDKPGKNEDNKQRVSKLYVAYRNLAVSNDSGIYGEEQMDTNYYRASSYHSADVTDGDKRIPVILSQEDEMRLFDEYY